jgi:hypothetical protein
VKVGDLIRDKTFGDVGLLIEIDHIRHLVGLTNLGAAPYCILYEGKLEWHKSDYIEYECEVIARSSR